jgi:hypothetical protein
MMDANSRESTVLRWEKAIWQSQIDVGLCTTPEPITDSFKAMLRRAAEAAADVFFLENEKNG